MSETPTPAAPSPARDTMAIARSLAIAAMLTCIAVSMAQLGRLIDPTWPGHIWVVLVFVVSIESMHSFRLLVARGVAAQDRGRFRFVEWVIILLVVRFALYLGEPPGTLSRDLMAWSENLNLFFDARFIVASILMAGFWSAALFLARTFADLDAADYELHRASSELERYLWQTMPRHGRQDRVALLQRVGVLFMGGGIVMILLAGMARVDVRDMVLLQHGRSSGVIFNVLLYFVIGLLLMSQAHYAALKAGWDLERLPVWDRVGRRWLVAVLIFLAVVGLLSALLPVGYSVGLIATIGLVIHWVWYIAVQVVLAILFVITFLAGLVAGLFGGEPKDTSFSLQPPPSPPPEVMAADGANAWWPLVRSLLFWTGLIALVGYSVIAFMRDRWGLFRGFTLTGWLGRLRDWLTGARAGLDEAFGRLRAGVLRWRASRAPQDAGRRVRFFSLGRLSARERVRYFYLATVRRAADAGVGRQPTQTPLEYDAVLRAATAEAESAATLTEAFVTARYSVDDVTPDDAEQARSAWQRLKRTLVRRSRRRAR
ncbi:MAG: DUF4129 domain-containing protein [Anaerolineae bacterium]|jgi:hypothetical protein